MDPNDRESPLKIRRGAPPQEIAFPAGTVVFREGDGSREVYLVLEGRLLVTCLRDGFPQPVAEIAARSVFGEMSLLDNRPRSATVTAIEDTRVVAIPPATLVAVLREVPPWFRSVLKVVVRRLREANQAVRRHCINDPLLSFTRFLSLRLPPDGDFTCPWHALVDEYHLVSRLPRDEIRRCAQIVLGRNLARIDSDQNLSIPETARVHEFVAALSAGDPSTRSSP